MELPIQPAVVYNQLVQRFNPASQSAEPIITSEMLDHLAAGYETSGITLTYLFHELSLRPKMQDALRTELLTLDPPIYYPSDSEMLPSLRALDTLPLLSAVLSETLRVHAVIPAPQPRMTPSGQRTTLAGYSDIPDGVIVGSQAYTLHRNAEVFPG